MRMDVDQVRDLRDQMQGSAAADQLFGRGGDDLLQGGAGDDALDGGIGADTLQGGSGNDQLQGSWGNDELDGGTGHDTLNGGEGSDLLHGSGDGDTLIGGDWAPAGVADSADYSQASGTVTVLLSQSLQTNDSELHADGTRGWAHLTGSARVAGQSTSDVLININRVLGSAFDDVLSDSAQNAYDETLEGGAGNDLLISHGGGNRSYSTHDVLSGGAGDDQYQLYCAVLDDSSGANGLTIIESANGGHDTLQIMSGRADYTLPANLEDVIAAELAQLTLRGNALDNLLRGGRLADFLQGAGGNDTLRGGDGADTLQGGAGNDQLQGGNDADLFVWQRNEDGNALDVVLDFAASQGDRLQLPQGSAYQLSGSADGLLLQLDDGQQILLNGISAQTDPAVVAGWIVRG